MKRLLLIAFLLFCFAGRYSAAPVYADCLGPNPTATPQPTYADKVLATSTGHLLAYWQLNETSGTTAADSSGNGRAGIYSGATLAATSFVDGTNAPRFDGINDFVNVYSSSLSSAFNGSTGSLLVWMKAYDSSTFTGSLQRPISFYVDANNRLGPAKSGTANRMVFVYIAGGASKNLNYDSFTDLNWFVFLETWDHGADQFKGYYDGTQYSTTQTGLSSWSGSLVSTQTVVGAQTTAGDQSWNGYIAHVALWDIALSSGDAANLAIVPSISPTATPYPTCTPSPTGSPSPTITPTPSNTALLMHFWTLPPPETTGTPEAGQNVAFTYTFSAGQAAISLLLFVLIISVIAIFLIVMLMRRSE